MAGERETKSYRRIALVDSVIERTRKTPYDAPDPERDANARLFAAAPRLLSVLKVALAESNCDGDLCAHAWHEDARQIIADAEGNL